MKLSRLLATVKMTVSTRHLLVVQRDPHSSALAAPASAAALFSGRVHAVVENFASNGFLLLPNCCTAIFGSEI
jgi:hypothetical protein